MNRFDKSLVLAISAVAVGCAWLPSVGPDYDGVELDMKNAALPDAGAPSSNLTATCEYRPAASNADERVVISAKSLERWWLRFEDPVLVDLVESSVTNNLSYLQAIARLEKANYELLGSYAAFLPKFAVDGMWSRYWANPHTRSGSGQKTGYNYNVGNLALDGKWEIDIFGGNRRLAESALAQAQSEGWNVANAWVQLTALLGQQYVSLRTTQMRLDVARTNLVLQSETYDILKSRLDSGIGDELAVNQCAYVVEQTRAAIPQLLAQEQVLKNSIAILAGRTPGELEAQLAPMKIRRDWLLAPQKLSDFKVDMLRARPDVRAAERALAAQVARIGVAKAMWYPKLFLNSSIGWEAKNNKSFFNYDSFFASIGPSVSWPIFQGGAIYANVKATEAKTRELALGYQLAVDKACGEVRDAYAAYTQEYHRYKSLASAVKAATDAVTISKDLYKNGLKDFNNVLDAQRSRLQFEEQYVISRGQITQNLISLYKALGGGLAIPDEEILAAQK